MKRRARHLPGPGGRPTIAERLLLAAGLIAGAALALAGAAGYPALAAKKKPAATGARRPVTLYGRIDELTLLCSAAGVQLTGRALPGTVRRIAPGSAASYSGLREGDKVLNISAGDSVLILDIERDGKAYRATIATDVTGLRSQFETAKIPYSLGDSPFDGALNRLKDCRITILLDRSRSMAETHAGCPGDLSKWTWCRQQIDNLFLSTARVVEGGFDLVPFNETYQASNGVTLYDLQEILGRLKPDGVHKNMAAPLEAVIDEYLKERRPDRPLIVLVLTDGAENSGRPLQDVLIEASRKVSPPARVSVTFLQVGDSIAGEELFEDLEHNLVAKGARYCIARYRPFSELRNKGLLFELLEATRQKP